MRKFLAFLVVFGGSLALLWFIERRSASRETEAVDEGADATSTGRTENPMPPVREPDSATVGAESTFQLGGRSKLTLYGEARGLATIVKLTVLQLDSEDSTTSGGLDVLSGVTMALFDPDSEKLLKQADILADEVRLRRLGKDERRMPEGEETEAPEAKGGGQVETPEYDLMAELEDVTLSFLHGNALAPLLFKAPEATLDARDPKKRRIRTEGSFDVSSSKLDVVGVGIDYHLDDDLIEIAQAGHVDFRRPEGRAASFSAGRRGALQIRGLPVHGAGPDALRSFAIQAWEGAELEAVGARAARMKAEDIKLRVVEVEQAGERTMSIEHIDAKGDVSVQSGESLFQGDRAETWLGAEGIERAVIVGAPRARLPMKVSKPIEPGPLSAIEKISDPVSIELTSIPPEPGENAPEGVLRLSWGERETRAGIREGYLFSMEGDTALETVGLSVRTANGLSGFQSKDETVAMITSSGGVSLETDRGTLDTANLEIEIETQPDGSPLFYGRAWGSARLAGTREDGKEFTLTTPDQLIVRGTKDGWRVVEGTRVHIAIGEPVEFSASANRIYDVDLEHLAFSAEGEVSFRGHQGIRRYDLTTDALKVATEELDARPGEEALRYRMEAEGAVQGTMITKGRTDELRCRTLVGIHEERTRAGADGPYAIEDIMTATGVVEARLLLERGRLVLEADTMHVERAELEGVETKSSVLAEGNVGFQGEQAFPFTGHGELLALDGLSGKGRLDPRPGERVEVSGTLPSEDIPFRMTAASVEFLGEELRAREPSIRAQGTRLHAGAMTARETDVFLTGGVRATGFTPRNIPWTLSSDELRLEGRAVLEDESKEAESEPEAQADPLNRPLAATGELQAIIAEGHVDFELGTALRARGHRLEAKQIHGVLRLEGTEEEHAVFESPFANFATLWIEFDPLLQMIRNTGPGRMIPAQSLVGQDDEAVDSSIEFLSTASLLDVEGQPGGEDSLVFLIQEPVFRSPALEQTLRASWTVFWIDRQRWLNLPQEFATPGSDFLEELRTSMDEIEEEAKVGGPLQGLFTKFQQGPAAGLLHEVYFEGPVEFSEGGHLLFRSDAVYFDAVAQRGWLAKATVNLLGKRLGESFDKLLVKADWLRYDSDGSLRANDATVTSCTFDKPHLQVTTGDLQIKHRDRAGATFNSGDYRLIMKDNRVELYDTLRIPLPAIDLATDEEFRPLWSTLSLANSARFGTLLSLKFSRPAGEVGKVVHKTVSGEADPLERKPYDADFEVEGAYLGSRGGQVDLGLEIDSPNDYWLDFYVGLIYDTGRDKGYVRVPESERDTIRRWIRAEGQFLRGDSALALSLSHQSDGAVLSEFYEGEFLTYEQDETYLQWHREKDEWYTDVTVQGKIESFRSQIEELPSLTAFHSRAPVFEIGDQQIVYVGGGSAAYLRRREGNELGVDLDGDGFRDPLQSPFGYPATFADGFGERETARIDTTHTLEAPMALDLPGARFTPFVSGRGTFWSESLHESEVAMRGFAEAGARLSGSFTRRNANGTVDQIAPYVGVRSELARDDEKTPIPIDEVENALTGHLFEIGTRARFGVLKGRSQFDLDLRSTYATSRSDNLGDGWLPLEIFSRVDVSPFGRRFELWYDARYDFEDAVTDYSLVSIGTRVGERFGLQAGHQRGRTIGDASAFEVASIEGIFRWTEKWEFEARQAFSLLDDQELDLRVLVRRYGHDVVLDIETSVREGEGTSFGLSVRPRLGYRRPRIGYVPW